MANHSSNLDPPALLPNIPRRVVIYLKASLMGIPILFAPAIGPVLAGWLVDAASWRWIFLLNLPVGRHWAGLQRWAAVQAARGSFADAREAIERATGVRLGKRQVQDLARTAAVDTEAFYAARRSRPHPGRVLGLQGDGTGTDTDMIVDNVTGIFRRIFAGYWGPRTDDIFRAACLTLLGSVPPGSGLVTLADIPPLLGDAAVRKRLTAGTATASALKPASRKRSIARPAWTSSRKNGSSAAMCSRILASMAWKSDSDSDTPSGKSKSLMTSIRIKATGDW